MKLSNHYSFHVVRVNISKFEACWQCNKIARYNVMFRAIFVAKCETCVSVMLCAIMSCLNMSIVVVLNSKFVCVRNDVSIKWWATKDASYMTLDFKFKVHLPRTWRIKLPCCWFADFNCIKSFFTRFLFNSCFFSK